MKFPTPTIALLSSMCFFPAAMAMEPTCTATTLDVQLHETDTETYTVAATLCYETTPADKTLLLTMYGSTYGQYYWDSPEKPEKYSFVRDATDHGYAVFNFDRIGNGLSDKPDGNDIDMEVQAFVTHQVVEALRAGSVENVAFDKIALVTHSMGAFVGLKYAATYPGEANGFAFTGFLHDINPETVDEFGPLLYPAQDDPKFPNLQADNYLTSIPQSRSFFYSDNEADYEEKILKMDEDEKQTVSTAELNTGPAVIFSNDSLNVASPVLVMIGEHDDLFCYGINNVTCSDPVAVQTFEETFWGANACLQTEVVYNSGHSINLHKAAPVAYEKILDWIDLYVGISPGPAPTSCP